MASTSTTELLLKFTGDPSQLKATLAAVRGDLSNLNNEQAKNASLIVSQWKTQNTQRVTSTKTANKDIESDDKRTLKERAQQTREAGKEIARMERERKQIAEQNSRAIASLAKLEADTRIREGRRALSQIINQLKQEVAERRSLAAQVTAASSRTNSLLAGAAGGIAALVGVSVVNEIRQAGRAWLDYSNKLETTRIAFTTMLGSAQAAEEHLRELEQFALRTPFELTGLIQASQRMQALGFNAQQVVPILNDVGNAVAAAGGGNERLDRVVLAISQIQSKGKLATQEINQLAEAGIPAWRILEQQFGKSRAELVKMVEQGQISSEVFIEAFQKFSQVNFGGLMEAQSRTFSGAMSNIKDALLQTSATAFEPLFQKLSETARHIAEVATKSDDFKKRAREVGSVVATMWDGAVAAALAFRDAIRLMVAAVKGQINVLIETFRSFIHITNAAALSGFAFARSLRGDTKGAMDALRESQRELGLATESARKAFIAQGEVVRSVITIYKEAEARAKALRDAQAKVGVDVGVGAGILRRKETETPAGDGDTTKTKKAAAAADPGVALLRQLQGELRRLTTETKAQEIAAQLLDEQFKNTNRDLREALLLTAQLIDVKRDQIEVEKKIKEETEKRRQEIIAERKAVADFLSAQERALGRTISELDKVRVFIAEIGNASEVFNDITIQILRMNASLIDSAERMQRMLDLMREASDAVPGFGPIADPKRSGIDGVFGPEIIFDDSTLGEIPPALNAIESAAAAAAEQWRELTRSMSDFSTAAAGVVKTAIDGISQAVGDGLAGWILYGEGFTQAMRKSLAAFLASHAAEYGAMAVKHLLYAASSAAFGNFAGAAAHLKVAALFGAKAGVTAIAAKAIVPPQESRFATAGVGGSTASTSQTQRPQVVELDRAGVPSRTQQNQAATREVLEIRFTGKLGEVIETQWIDRYTGGGRLRNVVITDRDA